jgi:DNA ligase-1
MASSNRREFLQLADHYVRAKHDVAGWLISEKLDGTRCFWDGGLSRGMPTVEVPWASVTDPKTGRMKAKIKPVATGLWSRYGNPILAPDWFLNLLPCCLLDGELWAGRGNFQLCRSICGGDTPDPRFRQIQYAVYSAPPLTSVFASGEIKNANLHAAINYEAVEGWVKGRLEDFDGDFCFINRRATFAQELEFLGAALENTDLSACYMHQQTKLIDTAEEAAKQVEAFLQKVLDQGGEGVVVRNPHATWTPKRHRGILKYKPFSDAEAMIVGFTSGRETDKGSKHLGRIGALIVDYGGKRLELSGLTDIEREFASGEMGVFASANPGVDMPGWFQGRHFKVGQAVTFKYRELSDDGIPKEGRYWRRRDME